MTNSSLCHNLGLSSSCIIWQSLTTSYHVGFWMTHSDTVLGLGGRSILLGIHRHMHPSCQAILALMASSLVAQIIRYISLGVQLPIFWPPYLWDWSAAKGVESLCAVLHVWVEYWVTKFTLKIQVLALAFCVFSELSMLTFLPHTVTIKIYCHRQSLAWLIGLSSGLGETEEDKGAGNALEGCQKLWQGSWHLPGHLPHRYILLSPFREQVLPD